MAAFWKLLILFLPMCQTEYELGGLDYTALDLNITLYWEPLSGNLWENEAILYTVKHVIRLREVAVPDCVNISSTVCCLAPIFPTGNEFDLSEYFRVTFISSLRPRAVYGASKKKQFSYHYVRISSPVIFNSSVTSSDITVWFHGPATPYVKKNRTRTMGERSLARGLGREKVYYKSNLTNLDDPNRASNLNDWTPSGTRVEQLVFPRLFPYTRYLLQVHCKLGPKYDKIGNVTRMKFLTKQHAPEFGTHITNHTVIRRSCDHRDVRLFWKESQHQRSNVEITSYTLTWQGRESGESGNTSVPWSNQSTVVSNMTRWDEYDVTVTSENSAGIKEGATYIIEKDGVDEGSYKPTHMTIEQVSSTQWNMSWEPPTDPFHCVVGYRIVTYIDDTREEQITVDGYDTTSVLLTFRRVVKYLIELWTVVGNELQTEVAITTEVDVKGWTYQQWAIAAVFIFLFLATVAAVSFMSWKLCCDLSRLRDIPKSRSMRLASSKDTYISSLKSPPEKEVFHPTKPCIGSLIESKSGRDCSIEDDVFEPHSTSSAALLPLQNTSKDSLASVETEKPEAHAMADGAINNFEDTGVGGQTIFSQGSRPQMDPTQSEYKRPSSGYVPSVPKTKPSLTVYIPKHISSLTPESSPHSWSADSGISTSPYSRPSSESVPASPANGSGGMPGMWYGYDVQSQSSYVASSIASRTGRIDSLIYESDQDPTNHYRAIGSNSLEGYLPMSPCSQDAPEPISPVDPYSKAVTKPEAGEI